MKRIFILGIMVGLAAVVACQTGLNDKTHLDQIAEDSIYIAYRTAMFINAAHTTQGLYDLDAIGEVIKSSDHASICDYPDPSFADIRGGLLYRDTNCFMHRAAIKLNEKYPSYWTLSEADKAYIERRYDTLIGADQQEELMEHFKNRFDD
ncbi:MAG: hypothetical protein R3301_06705 [Saprospiraceae bacterium]|nr:hypothetical protein [Saprospiraceae bacterium]